MSNHIPERELPLIVENTSDAYNGDSHNIVLRHDFNDLNQPIAIGPNDTIAKVRYYQAMNSHHRFPTRGYCGCITGKQDCCANLFVWGCIIVVTAAFAFFFGHSLHQVSVFLPITYSLLLVLVVFAFAFAQCSDPGVVPKQLHPKHFGTVGSPYPGENALLQPRPATVPPDALDLHTIFTQKFILPSGDITEAVEFNYCPHCHIYAPPGTAHCRECLACTTQTDHHCTILNNCVSQRNYCAFLVFVGSLFFYLLTLGATFAVFAATVKIEDYIDSNVLEYVALGALATVMVVALVAVLLLGGFHCFANCCEQGKSTRAMCKLECDHCCGIWERTKGCFGKKRTPDPRREDYTFHSNTPLIFQSRPRYKNTMPQETQDALDACETPEDYARTWIDHHTFLFADSAGNFVDISQQPWRKTWCCRPTSMLSLRSRDFYPIFPNAIPPATPSTCPCACLPCNKAGHQSQQSQQPQ